MAAISQETREAVERDLRERWGADRSIRIIAQDHGVSSASVRRIAAAAGITADVALTKTKTAREQLKEENARRRERLSERLLSVAEGLLDDLEARRGTVVSGLSFGEAVARRYDLLAPRDAQALATAAGIALDKHRMLDTYDQDRDTTEVGKFLRALAGES